MSSLGMYPTGARPKGAIGAIVTVATYAALSASGVGIFTEMGASVANAAMNTAGAGGMLGALSATASASTSMTGLAAFTPILTAKVEGTTSIAGGSLFGGSNSPGSVGTFEGNSTFSAVVYAFFLDAERACAHQELRVAIVPVEDRTLRVPYEDRSEQTDVAYAAPENRVAIVSFEDRVLRILPELRGATSSPRKRIC